MNGRWLVMLSVVAVLSLLVSGCQQRPTAEEIVAKMQEVEASTEDAHAVVAFSVSGPEMEMDVVTELWEKRPDKLRVEVLEASQAGLVGAISVTDGRQAWAYDPGENRVLVGDLSGTEGVPDPQELIQQMEGMIQHLLDISDVKLTSEEVVGGAETYVLELTPKEDGETILPAGFEATLWVEKERWIVLQAHVVGDMLGEGEMSVRSFELNAGLADDIFQFEIPVGAEVVEIEDRQPQAVTLDEAEAQAEFDLLVPAYVPEDATLVNVLAVGDTFVLHYDHSDVSFSVIQGTSAHDQEMPFGDAVDITVRGKDATLISDGQGNSFLVWTEGGVDFVIAGRISADEVVEVAESLQ